ncbi:MAG: UDP-N-acetylmuramoyl-L-alanyl-D-glutamate--2,6-diaminopimelate ligase [Gammaproteobacteria bacterium]|nr:UDP-N-acetylmuramoyl-L-alanyl-D-glutamate--2,6-diaminopimelate ligase [Gammaproteobacteria bacterium]MDH4253787.1 UDP-N-acetylmuramoyl-L-alanyl-D-glutamate--2,6-diaminopimelate ligase [Gammaproteobacteria bacterium]MDH5308640.1 UDP-N-acetylmuramoyl-L-alanyl-D-glutamate--2,6-diaminopimelate ligase [Gammaproteobacteria bacterium]
MSMPAEQLPTKPNLQQLLAGMADAPPLAITGIADDSRRVRPGNLFIAWQGATTHGLAHAPTAIERGAAAVAWDSATGDSKLASGSVPFIGIEGLGAGLGEVANRWYDSPSRSLRLAGVTGTNGKTTVAYLATQAMQLLGRGCGYIGTLGAGIDELRSDVALTTPPCLELHRLLAEFRDAGADYSAIEVSSHALVQDRVNGLRFDTTIFTNLSRDHIDYHSDMRAYFESKARLFTSHSSRHQVVSVDCEYGMELAERCGTGVVRVATRRDRQAGTGRHVAARDIEAVAAGYRVRVASSWGQADVSVPLAGEFNVSNALVVLALLLCWNVSFEDACAVIEYLAAPPGRLQRVAVEGSSLPAVYVDYAHTPAALEAVLRALRSHTSARLWCVFGCGGDRDRGKRPLMGAVASRDADRAVVTNDNPRTEPPSQIIADVLAGMDAEAIAIESRSAAIAYAIREAAPGDVVLIAGKGHEDYQIIGDQRHDFSDYQAARANLEARANEGERP